MKLNLESKLGLYALQIRKDKKNYIVEDEATGDFYEMPKICIDAIEFMQSGKTLGEVEKQLVKLYPEEEVNVIDFAEQLVEFGLIQTIDGEAIINEKKNNAAKGFEWISPKLAKLFFNKFSNKLYVLFFLVNGFLLITNPEQIPHYRDIFIVDSTILSIVIYMAISLVFIIIHEFGHVLAVRSYGLPTRISVGHRLVFLVFETDLTSAWKLPPKKRNTLYLAGMAFEQVIMTTAILLSLFSVDNPWVEGILGIVIFDIAIKTVYQWCFYMKTDLYYVVENITGCYNLMESAKAYLSTWNPFRKQKGKPETFQSEKNIIRLYSIFYLLGITLTITLITNLIL